MVYGKHVGTVTLPLIDFSPLVEARIRQTSIAHLSQGPVGFTVPQRGLLL